MKLGFRTVSPLIARKASLDIEGVVNWQDWTPGRRRAFLRVFIDRVVILPWPEGMRRTPPRWRWKDEPEEDYIARRERDALEVIAKRVRIVWRWERMGQHRRWTPGRRRFSYSTPSESDDSDPTSGVPTRTGFMAFNTALN